MVVHGTAFCRVNKEKKEKGAEEDDINGYMKEPATYFSFPLKISQSPCRNNFSLHS